MPTPAAEGLARAVIKQPCSCAQRVETGPSPPLVLATALQARPSQPLSVRRRGRIAVRLRGSCVHVPIERRVSGEWSHLQYYNRRLALSAECNSRRNNAVCGKGHVENANIPRTALCDSPVSRPRCSELRAPPQHFVPRSLSIHSSSTAFPPARSLRSSQFRHLAQCSHYSLALTRPSAAPVQLQSETAQEIVAQWEHIEAILSLATNGAQKSRRPRSFCQCRQRRCCLFSSLLAAR